MVQSPDLEGVSFSHSVFRSSGWDYRWRRAQSWRCGWWKKQFICSRQNYSKSKLSLWSHSLVFKNPRFDMRNCLPQTYQWITVIYVHIHATLIRVSWCFEATRSRQSPPNKHMTSCSRLVRGALANTSGTDNTDIKCESLSFLSLWDSEVRTHSTNSLLLLLTWVFSSCNLT